MCAMCASQHTLPDPDWPLVPGRPQRNLPSGLQFNEAVTFYILNIYIPSRQFCACRTTPLLFGWVGFFLPRGDGGGDRCILACTLALSCGC